MHLWARLFLSTDLQAPRQLSAGTVPTSPLRVNWHYQAFAQACAISSLFERGFERYGDVTPTIPLDIRSLAQSDLQLSRTLSGP
jgi:hydroxyacyl-ACP dehydratase HTD2-like protein with hotdog domain